MNALSLFALAAHLVPLNAVSPSEIIVGPSRRGNSPPSATKKSPQSKSQRKRLTKLSKKSRKRNR
jgi:hypothetical protein